MRAFKQRYGNSSHHLNIPNGMNLMVVFNPPIANTLVLNVIGYLHKTKALLFDDAIVFIKYSSFQLNFFHLFLYFKKERDTICEDGIPLLLYNIYNILI